MGLSILKENERIDTRTMPQLDMIRIQAEDEEDEMSGLPPRFGFPHPVKLNLENSGTWIDLPNGDKIWRLMINCPGALSINLLYDKFWLPEKAKFFVYSNDKKQTIGAFTSVNNKGKKDDVQGFATGLIYGDNITLEYYLPRGVREVGLISIAYVVHGYRYINLSNNSMQSLGSSGGCQVNVNCPEGANWQQEKNAVALILVNGTRYCTGSLINTTCNDNAPLFLTADHCLGGWVNSVKHDAISDSTLNHWSFYWQYESPTCSNPSVEPPIRSTVGATVIANNSNTDFALLKLKENPIDKTGVTPYYLGWDRSGNAGSGGVGIHHPRGDIKKISTYSGTPVNSTCMNSNFWQTGFVATTSGYSVMEEGSSGSPLINSSRRIIGQLLGPGNQILCPPYQCDNPSLQQVSYGKFSVSWTGGGATDSRRRLRDWLDPLGVSPTTLDGKASFVTEITGSSDPICTSGTYTLSGAPTGATINWSAVPSGIVTLSPSGNSVSVSRISSANNHITLTAEIVTTCGSNTIAKDILVGAPLATLLNVTGDFTTNVGDDASFQAYYNGIGLCRSTSGGITEVQWTVDPSGGPVDIDDTDSRYCRLALTPGAGATLKFSTSGTKWLTVRAKNACGWSVYANFYIDVLP